MDLKVWILAAVLIAVQAEPEKKQQLPEDKPQQKTQIKRHQNYQMKEVMLFLTPSQIKALHSGYGLINHHEASQLQAQFTGNKPEAQQKLSPEELQNQHQLQNELAEADRHNREKLQEIQNLQNQELIDQPQLQHEPPQPHPSQLPPQPHPSQLPPQPHPSQLPPQPHPLELQAHPPQLQPHPSELHPHPSQLHPHPLQLPPQQIPQPESQLQYLPLPPQQNQIPQQLRKHPQLPENYAYLYFYPGPRGPQPPQHLPIFPHFLQLQKPHQNIQVLNHPVIPKLNFLPDKYQLVPYEYGIPQIPEFKILPAPQPTAFIQPDHEQIPVSQPLVAEPLPHIEQESPPSLAVAKPPAEFVPQTEVAHQLSEVLPEAMPLLGEELKTGQFQDLEFHKLKPHQLEFQHLGENLDIEQLKAQQSQLEQQLASQLEEEEHKKNLELHAHIEAENLKNLQQHLENEKLSQLHTQLKNENVKHIPADHFKDKELQVRFKSVESEKRYEAEQQKSDLLKAHIVSQQKKEKEHIDALNMDAHHQILEIEAEAEKAKNYKPVFAPSQQNSPEKLELFQPNFGQFEALMSPLLKHHSIIEQLKQKAEFELNPPPLEGGFKPVKYEVKNDVAKYAKEVEKILQNAHKEKQEHLAKAVAEAQEEALTLLKDESKKLVEPVKVPLPYYLPVPEPKPYGVPLEIINHIPVPLLKVEKVEIEKPEPYEVEKHVPVTVTKNVFVPVEKPYIVEKRVPVEIRKEIPVKISVMKPQKFTIVRHIWEH